MLPKSPNQRIGAWSLLHLELHPEGSAGAPIGTSRREEVHALFGLSAAADLKVRARLRFILNRFGGEGMIPCNGISIQLDDGSGNMRVMRHELQLVESLRAAELPPFAFEMPAGHHAKVKDIIDLTEQAVRHMMGIMSLQMPQ